MCIFIDVLIPSLVREASYAMDSGKWKDSLVFKELRINNCECAAIDGTDIYINASSKGLGNTPEEVMERL